MTTLALLAAEYRADAAKLADLDLDPQTVADTLDGMGGDLQVKAQNVALVIRDKRATADTIRAWAKIAMQRADAEDARADSLTDYLAHWLAACEIERVEGPGVRISWRKSSAVVIDEPGLIPADLMTVKPPPEPEPSKTLIAAAIKAGRDVPGAHVEERRNLQIK